MPTMGYTAFESRVRDLAADKSPWLVDPDEDADLQYSFIRSMYWICESRPIAKIDGFIIGQLKQRGTTPEAARESIRPARDRFGAQCAIDDSEFQAFIHPSTRGSSEHDAELEAPEAEGIAHESPAAIIDSVMASLNCPDTDRSHQPVEFGDDVALPSDYRYFLERYGTRELSDEIELTEPWPSQDHVPGSTYWVIGRYWKNADGDDLLMDPASGKILVYLHEERGRLQEYAASFSFALYRLAKEARE